jgi:hypothetical protein
MSWRRNSRPWCSVLSGRCFICCRYLVYAAQGTGITLTMSRSWLVPSGSNSTGTARTAFSPLDALSTNMTSSGVADTRVVEWTSNPFSWANVTDSLNTGVITVDIIDPDSDTVVQINSSSRLRRPMRVSLPIPPSTNTDTFRCTYWDPVNLKWSDSGTVLLGFLVDSTTGNPYAMCGTMHLTEFASVKKQTSFFVTNDIDLIDDAGVLVSAFEPQNLVVVIVIGSVVGAFLLSWMFSAMHDETKTAQISKLHQAHLLMFGEVRSGLGMHTVHLSPTDPERIRVVKMFESLKVRVWRL